MSKKILLIEDDADFCFILKNVLTKAGYTVGSLHEGKSIVERDFLLPDMFILDNYIPTIDGIALCKYLKLQAKTKDIPVIIVSGNHQIKHKANKAGAAVFLGKPFRADELLKLIADHFRHPKNMN